MFSEFESKILEVSKIEEDTTPAHMCKVKHATAPFRATWLRQLHVSPLSYKMLMFKFVISVLKLEEVTENLLSKLFPLDQLNPVHLS